MEAIQIQENNPVIVFAAEELQKYYSAVTGVTLPIQNKGNLCLAIEDTLDDKLDEYAVRTNPQGEISILGANARSVLFGVYAFCERVLGVRFLRPDYEWIPRKTIDTLAVEDFSAKAAFPLRSYCLDRPDSMIQALDMRAKQGLNMFSVNASAWEANQSLLAPELRKRGMKLSISGHDLAFYIPREKYFSIHPEWYALYEGKRTPEQFCFSNEEFIRELAAAIKDYYCKQDIAIDSLVLMFNDNAFKCGCEHCRKTGFMQSYLHAIERVQQSLNEQGVPIELYHIAYNAALAWDMLEFEPTECGNGMIACWGRNYSFSVSEAKSSRDIRFRQAFENWGKQLVKMHKGYRVFEYYADYWMMASMLPPLGRLIEKDIAYFRALGITGIDQLEYGFKGSLDQIREIIEPLVGKVPVHQEYRTVNQIAWFNQYLLGKMMWEPHAGYTALLADYSAAGFGAAAPMAAEFLEAAETALTPLSEFSTRMFKLRITEAWYRDDYSMKGTGKSNVHPWSPEDDSRTLTKAAADACMTAWNLLQDKQELLCKAEAAGKDLPDIQRENLKDFLNCAQYFINKTKSLNKQYTAQLAIEDHDMVSAAENLKDAFKLETSFDGMEIENCQQWLSYCESHK